VSVKAPSFAGSIPRTCRDAAQHAAKRRGTEPEYLIVLSDRFAYIRFPTREDVRQKRARVRPRVIPQVCRGSWVRALAVCTPCGIEFERNGIPKRKNENNFVYYCEAAVLVRVSAHGCGQLRFTGTQFW
jgi:hypothetical protein